MASNTFDINLVVFINYYYKEFGPTRSSDISVIKQSWAEKEV